MSWTTRKRIFSVGVALLLLLAGLIALGPRILDLNRYRDQIAAQVAKATGGEVSIGAITWTLDGGFGASLENLSIAGSGLLAGDLTVAEVDLIVALVPLLSGTVTVDELAFERPSFVVAAPHAYARSGKAPVLAEASPSWLAIEVRHAQVRGGTVTVNRPPPDSGSGESLVLSAISADIANVVGGQDSTFDATAAVVFGDAQPFKVAWKGTLTGWTKTLSLDKPSLRLDSTVESLTVAALQNYFPSAGPIAGLSGAVSMSSSLESDLEQRLSATGTVDLSRLSYENPALWTVPLSSADASLAFGFSVDSEGGEIQRLGLTVRGQTLDLKARIADWNAPTVVDDAVLNSSLDLKKLAPLLPWVLLGEQARIVKPIVESGGTLVLTNARLAAIDLSKPERVLDTLLAGSVVPMAVSGMSFDPGNGLPRVERVGGNLLLKGDKLTAAGVNASVGPLSLPELTAEITDVSGRPKLSAKANGPMKLVASDALGKLLRDYGLKTLEGGGLVDLDLDYDPTRAAAWSADGSLALTAVTIETFPENDRIEGGNGKLSFTLNDALDVRVEDFRGRLNGSAFRVHGEAKRIGTRATLLNGTIKTDRLDLARLAAFVPFLGNVALKGQSDLDVRLEYDGAHPETTRAAGTVRVRKMGFVLAAQGVEVEDLNTHLELRQDDSVLIKSVDFRVNGQALTVSGKLENPGAPKGWLNVRAKDLDVDRLVAELKPLSKAPPGNGFHLPTWLLNTTLELDAGVTRGRYRGEAFSNLELKAEFRHGRITKHRLGVDIAGGQLSNSGTLELDGTSAVKFDLQPTIKGMDLTRVLALLGKNEVLDHGILNLAGDVGGSTGSTGTLIRALDGHISIKQEAGTLTSSSILGRTLLDMLTFINIQGVLEGDLGKKAREAGIPYKSLTAKLSLSDGKIIIHSLQVASPALEVMGSGTVNAIDSTVDANVAMGLLATIEEILGVVPIVGKVASDLTEVHLHLEGPLRSPHYRLIPGASVATAVKDAAAQVSDDVKRGFRALEKRL